MFLRGCIYFQLILLPHYVTGIIPSYNNYGGVIVPHVKKRKISPKQDLLSPTQEIISPTQDLLHNSKSFVGLIISYARDNKSYVGLTKSYIGDNKSYVGDLVSPKGIIFLFFFSHVALIRHRKQHMLLAPTLSKYLRSYLRSHPNKLCSAGIHHVTCINYMSFECD